MQDKILQGVKVVELTNSIGGAYAGRVLAMAGAEVIRIEQPDGSNQIRNIGPFVGKEKNIEKSIPYVYCNPNKKSVTLDIEKPEGQRILKSLLKDADVFIKEELPSWCDERGIGWDELHEMNPKLIVGSLTPYGEVGPYKDYKAHPLNVSHLANGAWMNPHASDAMDKPPVMAGGNFEQYDISTIVLIGILAAMYHQLLTGKGQYVPISAMESCYQIRHTEVVTFPVFEVKHSRAGALQKAIASQTVPCKDGYITPFLIQQHECNAMAKMIGKEEWLKEDWFTNPDKRRANNKVIREALIEYCKDYTMDEISEKSQQMGASLGPTYTPDYVVDNDKQFESREFFTELDHPELGKIKYPGRPFIMSETPFIIDAAPPKLGQHNEEVLSALGEDLDALKASGII